jgi:hypothetical protein
MGCLPTIKANSTLGQTLGLTSDQRFNSIKEIQEFIMSSGKSSVVENILANINEEEVALQMIKNSFNQTVGPEVLANKMQAFSNRRITRKASRVLDRFFNELGQDYNISVNFHESSPLKTERVKGWYDGDSINYVKSEMHFDTYMHEFSHVWIRSIKNKNESLYTKLKTKTEAFLSSNSLLAQEVNNRLDHKVGEDKVEEAMAIIAGLVSIPSLIRFTDNYSELTTAEDVFGEDLALLYDEVKDMLNFDSSLQDINLEEASILDLFMALTNDVFEGKNVFKFQGYDVYDLNDLVQAGEYLYDKVVEPISGLDKFADALSIDKLKSFNKMTDAEIDNYLDLNQHKFVVDGKSGLEFRIAGQALPVTVQDGKITPLSKGELRPVLKDIKKLQDDKLIGTLNFAYEQSRSGVINLEEVINKFYSTKFNNAVFNKETINMIADTFDIETVNSAMKLSDAITAYPEVFGKIDKTMYGDIDPIIVFHYGDPTSNRDLQVSLYINEKFITPKTANKHMNIFYELSSKLDSPVSDSEMSKYGTIMKNTSSDINNLMLGFLVAHMADVIPNMKFSNVGTIEMSKTFKSNLADVTLLFKTIKEIKNITELYDLITNPIMKDIIDKLSNNSIDYHKQGYKDMLRAYYTNSKVSGTDWGIGVTKIFGRFEDMSTSDKLEFIKLRMRSLEHFYGSAVNTEPEYIYISRLYLEETKGNKYINQLSSKGGFGSTITQTIALMYNIDNEVVQAAGNIIQVNERRIVNRYREYSKQFKPILKKVWDAKAEFYNKKVSLSDVGSSMFQHLFVKKTINGEVVNLPYIYHNGHKDIKGNRESAKNRLNLTDNDLALGDFVMDSIEEYMIDSIIQKMYNSTYSANEIKKLKERNLRADAREYMKQLGWNRNLGQVVYISKNAGELSVEGNLKASFARNWDKAVNYNKLFQNANIMSKQDELHNAFLRQLNPQELLGDMGLKIDTENSTLDNTQYIIENKLKVDSMSTNIETILNYVVLASIRQEIHSAETEYAYKAVKAILDWEIKMAGSQLDAESINRAKQYLTDYYKAIVLNKKPSESMMINTIDVGAVAEMGGKALSFMYLAYSPRIGLKSFFYNLSKMMIFTTANTFAGDKDLPGVKDVLKAMKEYSTDMNRVMEWGAHYQVANASMYEVLNSAIQNITKSHALNEQFGHIFNQYTDEIFRHIIMVSAMIKDGSWDAHKIIRKSDGTTELFYDEKLDERLYSNGKLTEEGRAHKAAIKADLIADGIMEETDENLRYGYDFQDAVYFKSIGDKWVLGAMGHDAASMVVNNAIGKQVSRFRRFIWDVIANAGVGGKEKNSVIIARRVITKDENGNLISLREKVKSIGTAQSILKAFNILIEHRHKSLPHLKESLTDKDKGNIYRILIWASTYMLLLGLYGKFRDEEDRRKYLIDLALLFEDTNVRNQISGIDRSLIPIFDGYKRLFKLSFTEPLELLYFLPGGRIADDFRRIKTFYE